MYLAFTRMPGDSYRRRFRYLLLCPLLYCDVCQTLLTPLFLDSTRSCKAKTIFVWKINRFIISFFVFFLNGEKNKNAEGYAIAHVESKILSAKNPEL